MGVFELDIISFYTFLEWRAAGSRQGVDGPGPRGSGLWPRITRCPVAPVRGCIERYIVDVFEIGIISLYTFFEWRVACGKDAEGG